MDRYKEIFKTLAEVLAVLGGIYQLITYKLDENWLYWVFLGLWALYLAYEFYVKLNFLSSVPTHKNKELRLAHKDDGAFRNINLLAGLTILGVLIYLFFTKMAVVEGGECLFLILALFYVVYATIHIPTIWLEVEEGYLKGSLFREKIPLAAIREVIITDQYLKIISSGGAIHQVKYLAMMAEEKAQSHDFFNSFLEAPGQLVVIK